MEGEKRVVALLHGPDDKGLVAKVANWIYSHGGNILHADQHRDLEAEVFFQRVEWLHPVENWEIESKAFKAFVESLNMNAGIHLVNESPNIALFVSKTDHCFHDLVLRWRSSEYPGKIACVISNHNDLSEEAEHYGLPYYHLPVSKLNKSEAEGKQLAILEKYKIHLVILARYMQILSPEFVQNSPCSIINIHHSFLPAFVGAKPYHQAYQRGVKIIGASAHYVTEELDGGPIIQQDVARINHRHSVEDIIRRGKDLEKAVLSQAVRWHLEHRVLGYEGKTVVFD